MSDWIFRYIVSQFDGFYERPPLDGRKLYVGDELIKFNNDGHETWLGTADKWHYFYKNADFRKFAFFVIRIWIFVDWFGLRSWIYYRMLNKKVERFKRARLP